MPTTNAAAVLTIRCMCVNPAVTRTPADGLHVGEVHPHKLPPVLRIQAAERPAGPVTANNTPQETVTKAVCMVSVSRRVLAPSTQAQVAVGQWQLLGVESDSASTSLRLLVWLSGSWLVTAAGQVAAAVRLSLAIIGS